MFDKYLYRVEENGQFIAGYGICRISQKENPVFLFTSLRYIRVTDGSALWKIGSRVYPVKQGDIVAVNNIEPRQFVGIGEGGFCCEIFAFSPSVFLGRSACCALMYNRSPDFSPVLPLSGECREEVNALLNLLREKLRLSQNSFGYVSICAASLICAVTADILQFLRMRFPGDFTLAPVPSDNAPSLVIRAVEYINARLCTPLRVEEIARSVHVSRGYLTAVFQKYIGIPPGEYISRCRAERTLYLIRTQHRGVLDAALESGFCTSSGFYKAFRHIYGMPPGEYLRSSENGGDTE